MKHLKNHYRKYVERTCVICKNTFINRSDRVARFCSRKCYGEYLSGLKTTEERFMAKIIKTNTCWLWIGSRCKGGYGHFQVRKKPYIAHRLSYTLFKGPIPEGHEVCHKCDNPSCVNPEHLFTGTHSDNIQDSDRKGRREMTKGENNCNAKLTVHEVLEIRKIYTSKLGNQKELAQRFNMSRTGIGYIVNRGWRHI